jgi:hypothetical protein
MNRSRDTDADYGWRNRDVDLELQQERKKKNKGYTQEERDYKDRFARGENVHVVCVDERGESKRAMKFALENVPRDHRLLLVHGHYDSTIADTLKTDRPSVEDIRSRFMRLCKSQGVRLPHLASAHSPAHKTS